MLAIDGLERFGEYKSLYFEGRALSNFERIEFASRLASVLSDRAVQPGDRVVVMMFSCPEVSACFHAVWRLGAVIVPIMPQLIPREIAYVVENSDAEIVLTSPELSERALEATRDIPRFRDVLVFGETNNDDRAVNIMPAIDSAAAHSSVCQRQGDELATLVYTSGTSGSPKGVMLSHDNLISNAQSVANLYDRPQRYRSLMTLPMSHVYGMLLMILEGLLGGVVVMLTRFEAETAIRTIDEYKLQRASLVPTMLIQMINCPAREKYDSSTLEVVTSGSAPLPEDVRLEFQRLFDCRVQNGYGQSEATCAVSSYHPEEPIVPGSCGHAISGIELCIMDDGNTMLPPGETGEICIRGRCVMQGYWKNDAATAAAIVDGWLHSGDIGHIDTDGYVFITDRKKDIIIKGAENISPREIEEAIFRHPAVSEAAVYGVPDDKYQEQIIAAVVVKEGHAVTADELRQHAAEFVTKFKIPAHFVFKDCLPKNSIGKVLKRTLREEWKTPT